MSRRLVLAGAMLALVSGCASRHDAGGRPAPVRSVDQTVGATGASNPALVFATPELQAMLAERGLPAGFGWSDWEYGRNDEALAVGAAPPRRWRFDAFQITQYDQLSVSGGRPRNNSRTTVRSVRTGSHR